jgi:hypothetical protein
MLLGEEMLATLQEELFKDVRFVLEGGRVIAAHRCIVCERSPGLAALIDVRRIFLIQQLCGVLCRNGDGVVCLCVQAVSKRRDVAAADRSSDDGAKHAMAETNGELVEVVLKDVPFEPFSILLTYLYSDRIAKISDDAKKATLALARRYGGDLSRRVSGKKIGNNILSDSARGRAESAGLA